MARLQSIGLAAVTRLCCLLVLELAAAAAAAGRAPHLLTSTCETELDCSLNGQCIPTLDSHLQPMNICTCDLSWRGSQCQFLDVLPVDKHQMGYQHQHTNHSNIAAGAEIQAERYSSSWCGSPIYNRESATYELYVSEMVNECGISAWETNSEVTVATSSNSPYGPYTYNRTLFDPYHHNPSKIIYVPSDDVYVMYLIGADYPSDTAVDCRMQPSAPRTEQPKLVAESVASSRISMAYTRSLSSSEWTIVPDVFVGSPSGWDQNVTNPSPLLLANNSILLAYRAVGQQEGEQHERLGMLRFDRWNSSTFTKLTADSPLFPTLYDEDPHLYMDSQQHFHMLTHLFVDWGETQVSRHYYSVDAVEWHVHPDSPYSTLVQFTDKSTAQMYRRERPYLMYDGQQPLPVALVTAVQPDQSDDRSFTLVQPLRTTPEAAARLIEQDAVSR